MAKLNVYVPDALRAQMAEHPHINWSGVAQHAFAREVAAEAQKTEGKQWLDRHYEELLTAKRFVI